MRIAYFTAGTTGAGHLVRGLALQRALARAGLDGTLRLFGPPLPFPLSRELDYQRISADPATLRDPQRAAASDLAHALRAFAPDLLLIDLFWAPLHHILPTLRNCPAWLLLRTCPPVWLRGPGPIRFQPAHYERIIAIEPLPHGEIDDLIDPVLLNNPEDCWSPGDLHDQLGLPRTRPLTVIAHAGKSGEARQLEQLARADAAASAAGPASPAATLVRFDLAEPNAPFPVAPRLAAADRIYLGAGYNAFWEAHWLGYAARTRFHPFPRRIDDQAYRLRAFRGVQPRANGADTLARWLLGSA